jgi:molybdate transport system ATP-binding protein
MTALVATLAGKVGSLEIDVTLDTSDGPLVLVGPNGAGKTSLLLMLLGAIRPARGRVLLGERVLFDAAARSELPVEEREIGYVPQDHGLMPHLSVAGNVAFALRCRGFRGSASALRAACEVQLGALEIRHLADRRTHALSGGERQRLALARALAARPRALLLDEPLAALDVDGRAAVRSFLADLIGRLEIPTIVVSHDAADARLLGKQIVVIERGKVVQRGTPEEIAGAPGTPFVAALFDGR